MTNFRIRDGELINFEGIPRSGKTTQRELLEGHIRRADIVPNGLLATCSDFDSGAKQILYCQGILLSEAPFVNDFANQYARSNILDSRGALTPDITFLFLGKSFQDIYDITERKEYGSKKEFENALYSNIKLRQLIRRLLPALCTNPEIAGKIVCINANRPVHEVFRRIVKVYNEFEKNREQQYASDAWRASVLQRVSRSYFAKPRLRRVK